MSKNDVQDFQNDQRDIHDDENADQSGQTVMDVNGAPMGN
jgi:hypothetical protein